MFKVGQKVVYIGDYKLGNSGVPLFRHEVYTVAYIDIGYLGIVELGIAPTGRYYREKEELFRPLDYDFVEEVIASLKEETVEA